jgi:hypothetical protein
MLQGITTIGKLFSQDLPTAVCAAMCSQTQTNGKQKSPLQRNLESGLLFCNKDVAVVALARSQKDYGPTDRHLTQAPKFGV